MKALILAVASLSLISCAAHDEGPVTQTATVAASAPARPTRTAVFDHNQPEHAKIACDTCHVRSKSNPTAVEPERPGHTACSGCHSSEDYLNAAASEPLCATCHPQNQILNISLQTRVLPFPPELHQFGVKSFSHRDHMDTAKVTEHPVNYGCATCHSGGTGVALKTFPAHAECYSCHVHQAGEKFGRCEDCHAGAGVSIAFSHSAGVAARDYHFLHSGHTKQREGEPIACETCHMLTAEAPHVSDIARWEPARGLHHTSTCWGTCHQQARETNCEKCHVSGIPAKLS